MCCYSGPLLNLDFFDVNILKHCTLHILNLGLLGVSNGSALQLGSTCGFRNSYSNLLRNICRRIFLGGPPGKYPISLANFDLGGLPL